MSLDPMLLLMAVVFSVRGTVIFCFASRLSAWTRRCRSGIDLAWRLLLSPTPTQRVFVSAKALRVGATVEFVIGVVLLVLAFTAAP